MKKSKLYLFIFLILISTFLIPGCGSISSDQAIFRIEFNKLAAKFKEDAIKECIKYGGSISAVFPVETKKHGWCNF